MNEIQYSGRLKAFLRAPLYMIAFFIILDVLLYAYDSTYGVVLSLAIIAYTLFVYLVYRYCSARLSEEVMDFATNYAMLQRQVLDEMSIPYALIDDDGKLFWMNRQMTVLTGKDPHYAKSITSIFSEITKEMLKQTREDVFSTEIYFNEHFFLATLRRMDFLNEKPERSIISLAEQSNQLIAFFLEDITELKQAKSENEKQRLVAGLIYIDNYEEVLESVESVSRSLLAAIIERKINEYFQDKQAIVRKLDKDKFFVVLQQQHLLQLEQDKFSLLEKIKSTKAGNEHEVTLSMGFGAGGATYLENSENARTAIDLALGRGGSQAVVKDGEAVSYYGARGKEIEKNTRVKARMKAQALREIMQTRSDIMIMGHNIADVDSFGASIGVYCAAKQLGKRAHIVINTVTNYLKPFVELFSEENGYPEDMFLNSSQAMEMANRRTLVVLVDTNRPSYADCPELLNKTDAVVVFDHHRQGKEQVQGSMLSYIEPYASSACEMIAEILQYFSDKIELKTHEADCIYAGVLIDTNNFMTKTGVRTFEAAAYLRRCGAEVTRVRKLLREDMNAYKARAEIVRNAEVYRELFAISVFRPGHIESPTVVGAKASNELLNIVGIKASFVLTEYKGKVYISSRSIDEIDVQSLMEKMGGGGHLNSAGAQVEGASVAEVKRQIQALLDETMTDKQKEA